jgi:hypothetical protein
MPTTIRKYWPGPLGPRFSGDTHPFTVNLNFNWDAIESDSVVLVTASEYVRLANPPPGTNMQRFVGDATIRVDDIAPHGPPFDTNRGVSFAVIVDFPKPLFIVTDITLFNDKPVETQG